MIIVNGTIQVKKKTGGGMLNGIPQPATETWGEPIPCNIKYNRSDHLGTYTDGRFVQLAATILIEPQQFDATHIKVTDNRGQCLGEHEVQDVQYLHAVEALQLTISNN